MATSLFFSAQGRTIRYNHIPRGRVIGLGLDTAKLGRLTANRRKRIGPGPQTAGERE